METKGQRKINLLQADSERLRSLIARGNRTSVSEFLYEKGAHVNSCLVMRDFNDTFRNFPLHLAVAVKPKDYHHDLVRYFISEGAGLNVVNGRGYSPLHYAVAHKNIRATRALLDAGANVNLQTDLSRISRLLLQCGDVTCFPPLHLALRSTNLSPRYVCRNYQYAIGRVPHMDEEFLEGHEYFLSYEQRSLYDLVQVLLSYGADCNVADGSGSPPLHYAVTSGDFNLTTILLDAGADINVKNENYNVDPPMFSVQNELMLKYLLSRNANAELLPRNRDSILHVSVEKGYFYTTRYLIVEVPALLHQEKGFSVLSLAVKKYIHYHDQLRYTAHSSDLKKCIEEHEKIIHLLLKAGCDPTSALFCRWLSDTLRTNNAAGGLELLKTMEEISCNPRSLQDMCTIRIRTSLQRNVTSAVKSLSLPMRLKEALTLVGQRV